MKRRGRGCLYVITILVLVWLVVGESSVKSACAMAGDESCIADFPIPVAHLGSGATWLLMAGLLWVPLLMWLWRMVQEWRSGERKRVERRGAIILLVTVVWYVAGCAIWGQVAVDALLSPMPWLSAVATTASLDELRHIFRRKKA